MGISSFVSELQTSLMEGVLYPLQPPARRRAPDKHMQVLCLGLSRSGTDSLRSALVILGYDDVYHGFVPSQRQIEDCAFWTPLMRRKFAGESVEGTDFDAVLALCEAVTDGPVNAFGEELMQFYPDAKVILNRRRDMDAWYNSMRKTCLQVFSWPMWVFGWFDTSIAWLWWTFWLVMQGYYHNDFEKHGKAVAKQHYERLEKALAEQQREYLDWSVEEGWEPLCKFLGKPIPDVPFPNGNKGDGQFQLKVKEATQSMVMNALRNMGLWLVGIAAVVAGVWYRSRE